MATATITPDQNAVVAEIFIAAPPARVFQAISDPSQLPKWWGQDGLYHVTKSTMDVRPGGKWRSDGVGADGKSFYVEGEYLEVDPPSRLVLTQVYERLAHIGEAVVTADFEESQGKTRLTLRQLFPSKEALEGALASGMERGMRVTLDQLDELVASTR